MIEDNQAGIEPETTIGKFKIIDGPAAEFGLDKIPKVVAPVAKTAAKRKGQIDFVEQFIARHQSIQHPPGIAELDVVARRLAFRPQLAT